MAWIIIALLIALLPLRSESTFKTTCKEFAVANMDPLVAPYARSSHEHSIAGSLGFDDHTSLPAMVGNLSSCNVIGDFSNYWFPSMFRTDLGPEPVRLTSIAVPYYEMFAQEAGEIDPTLLASNVSMIVGHALGDPTGELFGISFLCQTADDVMVTSPVPGFHPEMTDCYQLRIDYTFPSCWDGREFQLDQSHVAYPPQFPDVHEAPSKCPDSHPLKLPEVRLEQRYEFGDSPVNWTRGNAPFVFASGDYTTVHADVTLLWDVSVLTRLIDICQGPSLECTYDGVDIRNVDPQNAIAGRYDVPIDYLP